MSYSPTTSVPNFASFCWSTPTAPTPRLASPIGASTTTIITTSAPLDHTGSVITLAFIMGIRNVSGYSESVYVPPGAVTLNADGSATLTGVTRGIYLEGLDFTTGNASLAVEADQSSTVFCNVSGIIQAINQNALRGNIGANIEFNGRPLWTGSAVASVPVFATTGARDAAIVSPANGDSCYVTAAGEFFDYQAGSWGVRATGVATPNGSTTVAGKWQGATVAQQGTATDTGSTGAELVPLNKNLVVTSAGAGDQYKLSILNASGLHDTTTLGTGAASNANFLRGDLTWTAQSYPKLSTGITTHDISTTGTQTIAHGLGKTPTMVNITNLCKLYSTLTQSFGTYDGSTANVVYNQNDVTFYDTYGTTGYIIYIYHANGGEYSRASVAVDATNITLTWTKNSSPTGTANILWEAQA